ncbi:hypothetical protein JD276_13920 [Leucobacter sp. CSA1]|uniref:TetR family transcriptional regulator n=1 Tax=Leucobacter chromiisoli TaxID=2796471 RepID=A0A934QA68_9MICO|nr:hypothetical protein [Leucobacter chromiisoli]MBK0420130.1 hypothetical protein [Leucobacter chromiisoli]
MPRPVDETGRRREIAKATLRIAERCGANAVTIRAVAEELGRSTAFVTNYVPSRAQLMFNALDHARHLWVEARSQAIEGRAGRTRLVELARWMCTTDEHDTALRGLWIEVLAGSGPETAVIADITDRTFTEFERAAREADLEHAAEIADILYLYARGFHVKNVEDPVVWSDDRVNRALAVLLERLLGSDEPRLVA